MKQIYCLGRFRFVQSIVLCLNVSIALAQLTDSQVRSQARQFTTSIGQPCEFPDNSTLKRNPFGQGTGFKVQSGEVLVFLDKVGKIARYADLGAMRTGPSRGADRFASDEVAWRYVENLLPILDVPLSLNRSVLRRVGGDGSGKPCLVLQFVDRPYGYKAIVGNTVSFTLNKVSGRIVSLNVSRGWSYEEPSIAVSAAMAKQVACDSLGGTPDEWQYLLEYIGNSSTTSAPQVRALYNQRKVRLCYNLWSNRGSVIVDSITGDIVWSGVAGTAGSVRSKNSKMLEPRKADSSQAMSVGKVGKRMPPKELSKRNVAEIGTAMLVALACGIAIVAAIRAARAG